MMDIHGKAIEVGDFVKFNIGDDGRLPKRIGVVVATVGIVPADAVRVSVPIPGGFEIMHPATLFVEVVLRADGREP